MSRTLVYILLIFAGTFSSCRVKYSFNGGSIPDEAKTVSVGFFQNNAPLASPTLSQTFTETLRDLFISQTKLSLVPLNGDLQFEGYISGYDVRPVAIQGNETASLNRLTITVSVKYVNRFNEKENFEQSFSRFADYSSSEQLSSVEESLIAEINRQLVQDIFDRSFGNW
ncbi:MAG: LptE family protein [Bacteroidota bacterium]